MRNKEAKFAAVVVAVIVLLGAIAVFALRNSDAGNDFVSFDERSFDGGDFDFSGSGSGSGCDGWTDVTNRSESGSVSPSGRTFCLRVPEGGRYVSIDVTANLDTTLALRDTGGTQIDFSDDYSGRDPGFDRYLDGGTYLLVLRPYSDTGSGRFDLSTSLD